MRAVEEEALRAFRGTREGKRLSGRPSSSALSTVGPSAEVRPGTLPAPSSSGKGVRVSRVGSRHPHRVGCLAVRYPPARACRSPPVWRRGLRSMTLPVPEVRPSRASWSAGAASPLTSLEGKTVPRRRRLSLPLPASPAAFRSTRAARLFRGIPVPSASASRPGAAAVRFSRQARWRGCRRPSRRFPVLSRPRPEGQGSPSPPRRCASLPRVCQGGPAAAPHPPSSPRPRPSAWNLGVVGRRGVSRGSASVWRRLGGPRRVASPGPGHPPPSSRCASRCVFRTSVRIPSSCAPSLRRCVCVSGVSGEFPSVPAGDRRPRGFSLVSLPARPPGCCVYRRHHHPRAPLARSVRSRLRSTAGRVRSPARAPTWLILPVAYACLKD